MAIPWGLIELVVGGAIGIVRDALSRKSESVSPTPANPVDVAIAVSSSEAAKRSSDATTELMRTSRDYRARLVELAAGELGKTDASEYHAEAFGPDEKPPWPPHWCQSFFVTMLHRAGLFHGHYARRGTGFEGALRRSGHKVIYTGSPEPGDLAFFSASQHHAMVERVEGGMVLLLQGNGVGKKVTRSNKLLKDVQLFYSIEPIIQAAIAADQRPIA